MNGQQADETQTKTTMRYHGTPTKKAKKIKNKKKNSKCWQACGEIGINLILKKCRWELWTPILQGRKLKCKDVKWPTWLVNRSTESSTTAPECDSYACPRPPADLNRAGIGTSFLFGIYLQSDHQQWSNLDFIFPQFLLTYPRKPGLG